jgi:hypothetical protein
MGQLDIVSPVRGGLAIDPIGYQRDLAFDSTCHDGSANPIELMTASPRSFNRDYRTDYARESAAISAGHAHLSDVQRRDTG